MAVKMSRFIAPIKVEDIELSQPIRTLDGLHGFAGLLGLIRLYGVPIGYIEVPILNGRCLAETIVDMVTERYGFQIMRELLQNALTSPHSSAALQLQDLFASPHTPPPENWPLVTVAVCTRDRSTDLRLTLESISLLDYPALEVLIVDNAPSDCTTEDLVRASFPEFRYIREPRPGLDWARNRAALEAQGEIIMYTDDDVVVDAGWVKAVARRFAAYPEAVSVTGLVVPYELETEAQILFEKYGGFGRGFTLKSYGILPGKKMRWRDLATWRIGTGANMAFRRNIFDEVGYFDPALDAGTITGGAGDLEMFFRLLKAGCVIVYEPRAMVRHRHRRTYAEFKKQLADFGGICSYFVCGASYSPDLRLAFLKMTIWHVLRWSTYRLVLSFMYHTSFPPSLSWTEIRNCLLAVLRYRKSRKIADQIADAFGPQATAKTPIPSSAPKGASKQKTGIAVRTVELTEKPIQPITNVMEYSKVRVFITWNGSPIGKFDISNRYKPISALRLCELIVNTLELSILKPDRDISKWRRFAEAVTFLQTKLGKAGSDIESRFGKLPVDVPVSIVIGTYDRPDNLRKCLSCLTTQDSLRKVEIIVVDNNPVSGLAAPVVAEFPGVILVTEQRRGVAYARNAGIAASTGDIIGTIDDDAITGSDWLEKLLAPFCRPDVMTVTGNVLPAELDTSAQMLFEQYGGGGLGRGFKRFEAGKDWFEKFKRHVLPIWQLGGTANAAFRARIFVDSQIGMMEESLGPGMPSGVGEDMYLFYKVLKAGYTIVYEPAACVWHMHRKDIAGLRRQLYNYSKGIVSYHLTTLFRHHDLRALIALFFELPLWHFKRFLSSIRGRSNYPLSLLIVEVAGHLVGPLALWRSVWAVKRQGRSTPYVPVSMRGIASTRTRPSADFAAFQS